jgi:hypothetical protein
MALSASERPGSARLDDANHFFGDLILQVENVLQFSVVSAGPKMRPGYCWRGCSQGGEPRAHHHPVVLEADIAHAHSRPTCRTSTALPL